MYYLDTSFLAPLILEEATSSRVEAYVKGLPSGELCVSHWTRVEFASLLAREVRTGGLAAQDALLAAEQFEQILSDSCQVISPQSEDYELACRFLLEFPAALRAGDSLHLAIARNHRAKALLTLDKALVKAGKLLKVSVSTGIKI